ncbi:MAG: signal peptidase II [Chloroflexi bacterium]|nr:signal peptidase II [Chloroflexota bacterium]
MEHATTWKDWAILLGVALLTIILDQITKWIVVQSLDYSETWEPIAALSGIFDITYTRNTGAAFGMAREFGGIFLIIAIAVVGAILYYYRTLPEGNVLMRIALGLQMGGAVGNAVDRVTRGFVVDFFHLHGWPIFNIADSAIVVGVVVLIITMWWYERQQEQVSGHDSGFGLGELRDDRES